jgi:predicted esterase
VAAGPDAPLPPVLIGRGTRDTYYTEAKQNHDRHALEALGVHPEFCLYDDGHVWTQAFRDAAANMLSRLLV